MFSVSRTQGSISLLEESTQPTESVQTLLTCYRQVVSRPQWHAEDWIVGNSEQAGTGGYRRVQNDKNEWS